MDILINFLLGQSVMIPVIMIIILIKRLDKTYYPFYMMILLGFFAELASIVLIHSFKISNAPVIKIYSLLECCLILYQLYLWKSSTKSNLFFIVLTAICVVFWIVETLVFSNLNTFSPYFRVFYAFIVILISINQINAMMFYHQGPLFRNPRFIICLGFTIFFLYQILYEASFFIDSSKSSVANKIIIGFGYINFIINLWYAVAIFYIDGRKNEKCDQYFNGA